MTTKKHILSLIICGAVLLPSLSYADGIMFRAPLLGVSASDDVDNSGNGEGGDSTPEPEPEVEGIQPPKDVVFTENGFHVTGNVNAAANIVIRKVGSVTISRVDSDENGDFEDEVNQYNPVFNGDEIAFTITNANDSSDVIYSEIVAKSDRIRKYNCLDEDVDIEFGDECYYVYGIGDTDTVMYVGTYEGEKHFLKDFTAFAAMAEGSRINGTTGANSRTDGYSNTTKLLYYYGKLISGQETVQGECDNIGENHTEEWFVPAADVVQNIINNKYTVFPFIGYDSESNYESTNFGFYTSTESPDDPRDTIAIKFNGEESVFSKTLTSRVICTITDTLMEQIEY